MLSDFSQIPQNTEEIDARKALIRHMLSKTKKQANESLEQHKLWAEKDPLFYTHLAAWYAQNGSVRDHQECFCAVLLASHRHTMQETGFVLLQTLRTYQVARIIKTSKETIGRTSRPLKRAVEFWLRRRENIPAWIEECALRDRHNLKAIYASLHIKPSALAQNLLFLKKIDGNDRFAALRKLRTTTNPREIAQIIRNANLPFTTAIGAIPKPTTEVWEALIEVMTAQQIINHMKAFRKRGFMVNSEIRALIDKQLSSAKENNRASQAKKVIAAKAMDASGNLLDSIMNSMRERIAKSGRIKDRTAIFIDKSGSMDSAIHLGKMLATACAFAMESPPIVVAFDSEAHRILVNKSDSAATINQKFELITASGLTSIGAPFDYLKKLKLQVDQIILISDGEQTTKPEPIPSAHLYVTSINPKTQLVFIEMQKGGNSRSNGLELKFAEIFVHGMTHLPFSGDYYGIGTILNSLSSDQRKSIVSEVLATKIPDLSDLEHLEPGFDGDNYEIK